MNKNRVVVAAVFGTLLFGSVPWARGETTSPKRAPERLVVKFQEAAQVRVRAGALVSLAGQDVSAVSRALRDHGPARVEPLFAREEAALNRTRRSAETRSGRRLPDLATYVMVSTKPEESESLLQLLLALPIVETAYRPAVAPPPPTDIPPPTPQRRARSELPVPRTRGDRRGLRLDAAGGTGPGRSRDQRRVLVASDA